MNSNESKSSGRILRLIAVFKLLKAASLIAVGLATLKLIHVGPENGLNQFVERLGLNPDGHYVDHAIGKVASIPPDKLKDIGFGSFVYAALFCTEGVGLWLKKRWAEWFTVIITASLVPLEIYELHKQPSAMKVVVLLINIAVVIYLIVQIRCGKRA